MMWRVLGTDSRWRAIAAKHGVSLETTRWKQAAEALAPVGLPESANEPPTDLLPGGPWEPALRVHAAMKQRFPHVPIAWDFSRIFAWDVDFSRDVQPGDEFQILYERLYRAREDGRQEYVRTGRILAARYVGAGKEMSAVYFEPSPGRGGYYKPDPAKADAIMRPSKTLNDALAVLGR